MADLVQDLRYALRGLARSPAFATSAILLLALGIGATTTVFSVFDAVLLRPLPAADPDRLVRLLVIEGDDRSTRFSYPELTDLRASVEGEEGPGIEGVAAVGLTLLHLRAPGLDESLLGEVVSTDFFTVLGREAHRGRTFLPGDGPVTVLSHELWQDRFAGDPAVLGHSVLLNGRPFTVVGVAPPQLTGTYAGARVSAWVPIPHAADWLASDWRTDREATPFQLLARLDAGTSLAAARQALAGYGVHRAQAHPEAHGGTGLDLEPARASLGALRDGAPWLLSVFLAMAGLVLVVACANLSSLLLARAVARRREMALRLSLGASRGRLARQLLTESLVLAVAGGLVGGVAALWVGELLTALRPVPFVPFSLDVTPDGGVFLFATGVTLLTGLVLGTTPLLQSLRRDQTPALRAADTAAASTQTSLGRSLFLALQVGASLVLLISAALFLQGLHHAQRTNPGFDPAPLMALDLDVAPLRLATEEQQLVFARVADRVAELPAVQAVAWADLAPVDLAARRREVWIPGHTPPQGKDALELSYAVVGDGYFRTLEVRVLAGRPFRASDARGTPLVAVVNRTLAERYWPGRVPLGERLRLAGSAMMPSEGGDPGSAPMADADPMAAPGAGAMAAPGGGRPPLGPEVEIVGVVEDVKVRTLGEAPTPLLYLPGAQHPQTAMSLLVRTDGDPAAWIDDVQERIRRTAPDLRAFFPRTLVQHLAFAMLPARLGSWLLGALSGFALLLAVVGIAGAVAYGVAGRRREIGIRLTLGAGSRQILRLVLRRVVVAIALGLALGTAGAMAVGRLIAGLVPGVRAFEPVTLAAVAATLTVVAFLSALPPALGALHTDPLTTLRQE